MSDKMKWDLNIVIPLYNEEECIGTLKRRILELSSTLTARKLTHEFILVNDGSTDGSAALLSSEFASAPNVRIVTHPENRGFGAALRTGLIETNARTVATVDADTNYDLRDIPVLLDRMAECGADLVTASPWHPAARDNDFPVHRYLFSIACSRFYRALLPSSVATIYTFTSGFRVYRGDRIREILPVSLDFIATAECLVNALLAGWAVVEEPWRVSDREAGRSKLKTLKTVIGHVRHVMRIRGRCRAT